ncbi:hypothetical protein ANN_10536 [Periplaneta americana]|uniref:Mos1 transposase HTH domain-containing protein n=1 Tax=Periplaneta americana TaxID=6978 RepID=A0ABQ8TRP2_PERAM|nr:hypothetical protein ANN_10536 [Periplaneta americana]
MSDSCYARLNLAVKLGNCSKVEQRLVTRFLWAGSVSGSQTHQRMCAQYGDIALLCRVIYKWIKKFENEEQTKDMILED